MFPCETEGTKSLKIYEAFQQCLLSATEVRVEHRISFFYVKKEKK